MPVSDSGMQSSVDDYNMSTGTRPKSPQEQTSRSKLHRQVSVTKHEYLGDEEHKRRQFSKQESKDSGIVTEMNLRPKDLDLTRSESVKARKKVEKTPSMRSSHSAKSKGGSMKYKQRSKTTSDLVPVNSNEENEIDLLTPKQNGTVENTDQDKSAASIKGMWKKAFKSLKSSSSDTKLSKKSSLKKKQQGSKEEEEEQEQESKEIDPVYSLLKCAADLPKGARIPCIVHSQCAGQHNPDSSSSTSKTSSPSSSVSHSPKARRKKLNARMKSFSLDAPDPSKHHLLAIDEITKKKSSSFTNTCLRASASPDEKYALSASNLRKKFAASAKSSSLDIESGGWSTSPKESPKVSRKMKYEKENSYVVLYHFKGKEKDDMDLRAGSRVKVTDSSDPDWWKGKCNAKAGYFPAKYVISLQKNQKVFQVSHAMHLTDGDVDMKLHKDQIVLQIGDEEHGMMLVKAANNKQAMCPLKYLNEV